MTIGIGGHSNVNVDGYRASDQFKQLWTAKSIIY